LFFFIFFLLELSFQNKNIYNKDSIWLIKWFNCFVFIFLSICIPRTCINIHPHSLHMQRNNTHTHT